ncbi:MAG: hypothetical protein K8S54_17150 [Spirochaetia bacterium]|nr:hypothetical protein [Spirochaetia bacterium]
MDEDLVKLLSNPFEEEKLQSRALLSGRAADLEDGTESHDSLRDMRMFRGQPETALYAHRSAAETAMDRLFSPGLSPAAQQALSAYRARLGAHFSSILKNFKVYVETCSEEILQKEVKRLERRYFDQGANEKQLNFLKLKRIFEKLKTFQELCRTDWREIFKIVDTLTVIEDTRTMARSIEKDILRGIPVLMRRTDHFLESMNAYMGGGEENRDPVTGTYRLTVNWRPELLYTIGHMMGDEIAADDLPAAEAEVPAESAEESFSGSIARNIVIDTREKILNKSSLFSALLLGSRDWNRTPAYSMEVPVRHYEECLENFKQSFIVHLEPSTIPANATTSQVAARLRSGSGESVLTDYVKLTFDFLEAIAQDIVKTDFPGLDKPTVFLYHCGPIAFYNILLLTLKNKQLGEIQYLDRAGNAIREYPHEILKKLLIDWWGARFSTLGSEDIDSYISYSRGLEIIKKDYRIAYNLGVAMRKKEQPHGTYSGLGRWMKENRARIFGIRKMEIFRRFIPGIFLNF